MLILSSRLRKCIFKCLFCGHFWTHFKFKYLPSAYISISFKQIRPNSSRWDPRAEFIQDHQSPGTPHLKSLVWPQELRPKTHRAKCSIPGHLGGIPKNVRGTIPVIILLFYYIVRRLLDGLVSWI